MRGFYTFLALLFYIGRVSALSFKKEWSDKRTDLSGCHGGHKEITHLSIRRGLRPGGSDDGPDHWETPPQSHSTHTDVEVSLRWRGRVLHLSLVKHHITPRTGVAEWVPEPGVDNVTVIEGFEPERECFYQGTVRGAIRSFAAVSLCGGMTGYIQTMSEGISIEPVEETETTDITDSPHILRSCFRNQIKGDNRTEAEGDAHLIHTRTKRAPSDFTKYIEVLLVADTTVVSFIGTSRVKQYLLGLMNIVNNIYHDHTLGTNIEIVTVKIMYMSKEDENRVIVTSDPKRTVDQFCQWAGVNSYRNSYHGSGVNYDIGVLLTRKKFGPAGYAPITGMCVPMRSCALVKDDGFTSSFVIAHEMAHVIGLLHDGQGNTCHGRRYTTSIMATMVQSSFNHYWWSECSRVKMQQVIRTLGCLTNNPHSVEEEPIRLPVGISWSLDEQCKLEFGLGYVFCNYFARNNPCAKLWCAQGRGSYSCTTKNVVPLDGTQCGPTEKWWCSEGRCGYHGNERPVNGGWGNWQSWSTCSTNCGIGFMKRSRRCEKPEAQFGGQDCDGDSEDTDTCTSDGPCTDYEDPRKRQCYGINDMPLPQGKHQWLPYQVSEPKHQCNMTCVTMDTDEVVTFDVIVEDGTPCSYDDPYNICLNGQCTEVGCDGVQGSKVKEDTCGVCGGDGSSCKTVSGVFTKLFEYSAAGEHYEKILVLPDGSRNVEIKETSRISHFLAVEDTGYSKYHLNGNGVQGRSKNFALEGAWFQYTNKYGMEVLETKGPLHRDVNIKIHPVNMKEKADVSYRYTVENSDYSFEQSHFEWKYEDWSECSVSCGEGLQHIVYGCYSTDTDEKVDDELCQYIPPREDSDVKCMRIECSEIVYHWIASGNFSECSKPCGDDGVRHQLYICENNQNGDLVERYFCTNVPEPIRLDPCNVKACIETEYQWIVTSTWTECSASCGDSGVQWQAFYCEASTANGDVSKVDEKFCADMNSPKEPRPCNRAMCRETYKWTVTSDWTECSEECGVEGENTRSIICQNSKARDMGESVDDRFCQSLVKPLDLQSCNRKSCSRYLWSEQDEWTECSSTCGTDGTQSKLVVCTNVTHDGSVSNVEDSLCYKVKRPETTRRCNNAACPSYKWVPTYKWTSCSVTCGTGYKSRVFECRLIRSRSSKIVEDELCKDEEAVNNTRVCRGTPCRTFVWQTDDNWSDCNSTCQQEGIRVRSVFCVEKYNTGQKRKVGERNCNEEVKPARAESCAPRNCPVFEWKFTDIWSECSTSCGETGTQTRLMKCVRHLDGATTDVPVDTCQNVTSLEEASRACDVPPCITYRPSSTDSHWSECSVTCGEGVETMLLECVATNAEGEEEMVDDGQCLTANLTKPQRKCDAGSCDLLEWGAGSWSLCSRTCGQGEKIRQVYCGNAQSPSDTSRCPGKPPSKFTDCDLGSCDAGVPTCVRDRASFCRNARVRLCQHAAYVRVCCKACQRLPKQRRRRQHRQKRRRFRHARRN